MALKKNKLNKASEKVGQAIAQSQYKAQAAKKSEVVLFPDSIELALSDFTPFLDRQRSNNNSALSISVLE